MIAFMKRNLRLFFRDKSAVFFSLLSVFIIIGLYALFLGDVWTVSLADFPGARYLVDSWIMAGLLSVTSVTTAMGALGTMVSDRQYKNYKDFYAAPVQRGALACGYILSSFLISIIMSVAALLLAQIYIRANGGSWLSVAALLEVLGLVVVSSLMNTTLVYVLVSMFRSINAYSVASTVLGTLIGFITGIYLPIGQMPAAMQTVVKLFPVSHAAALFRQAMMRDAMVQSFAGVPAQYVDEFKTMMGVAFNFGDWQSGAVLSYAVLAGTTVVFVALSVYMAGKKIK